MWYMLRRARRVFSSDYGRDSADGSTAPHRSEKTAKASALSADGRRHPHGRGSGSGQRGLRSSHHQPNRRSCRCEHRLAVRVFPSKDALFAALRQRHFDELAGVLSQIDGLYLLPLRDAGPIEQQNERRTA